MVRICFWLILAVGIFARVFLFGDVPGDINQDEAFAGYNAFTLMHHAADSYGYRLPVYLTAWGSGMNALESYLMIPFVAIFGLKVWVIRLPMLLVGILSLVAVYHLVRRFSSGKLALAAMFLVAISPWHVMLSRWALESNLAPGFVLFGMFFFVKGLEKPKLLVASALCFGLSLYAYATVWSVVPFIVVACVAYALWARSLRHTRYVWISLGVLVTLACPLVLFLLVNKGVIPEIKLPFLSIPKLVYFRDSEISFVQIPRNFFNLVNILRNQSDYLPWNSFGRHGLFYPATLAFFFVGLCVFIWKAVQDIYKRRLGLYTFVLVWLLAGFVIGVLINVNVNRVNLLFLPLLIISAFGIVFAFERIHVRALVVPLFAYLICFATFEKDYFTTYRDHIGSYFCEGIEDAMSLALSKSGGKSVVVDPDVSYPRVLFYGKVDLNSYLSTVKYINFPSAFLYVRSFDKYIFTDRIIPEHRQDFVYLLENSGARMKALQDLGYNVECFGKYVVGY